MAAAMIKDRGLRKKLTQEAIPEKTPKKPSKRKSTPSSSKSDKRNEQNNNKRPKIQTGDPKVDLFTTYQPWVIQTYGDLAKTKTITLKKYARILRTLRGEECNSSDSSKFRFWVKAKGFHVGKPPGYDAKPADGIVCRYSIVDSEGCARGPDGLEIYTGSQSDPPLYIPTPPLKMASSSQSRPARKRKAPETVNILNEQQILQWIDEDEDFSDCDDDVADKDFTIEEEIQQESEISADEDESLENEHEMEEPIVTNDDTIGEREVRSGSNACYLGKNGFSWSKTDFARTSRIPARNIISLPVSHGPVLFPGYKNLWEKNFDNEMVETLVVCTNRKLRVYRQKFANYSKHELRDTNDLEIRSLLGLLYYSSVFKCNDADTNYLFATDGTGHEIFRCVMSKYRFSTLINCLRLDNIEDREERLKTDPLAAVSFFFNKFIANSQSHFIPGPYTCIDEMLVAFKGRCKFIVYMPNKPAKYGIKIMVLTDAQQYYVYNAYIYHGKGSDGVGLPESEKKLAVPTQSVLRLAKPIENTNRNVTADNWFSSIPLTELLLKRGLTYLGTLKRNKREIPPQFLPNKKRPVESSIYGFTKDLTLLSFMAKKDKAVILLSSCHHSASTDENTGKPTMIVDYNQTKGGVDEVDKKCAIYSCSRKTRRWPQAIFYRLLDMAGVNTFVIYGKCEGANLRRGQFILNLARELVLPALKQRVYNEKLPRELRMTLRRVLGNDLPPPPPREPESSSTRKLCRVCPSKLKRQTRFTCCACAKPICLQCSAQICEDCKREV